MAKSNLSVILLLIAVLNCNTDDRFSTCNQVYLRVPNAYFSCKELLVDQGDDVVLKCIVYNTTGTWQGPNKSGGNRTNKNSSVLYTDREIVNPEVDNTIFTLLSNEYGKYDLEISNFSKEEEGTYQCLYVPHIYDKPRIKIYIVFLKRPPTNLRIHDKTENNTIIGEASKNLTIECTVDSGKPRETVKWIRDGQECNTSSTGRIFYTFLPIVSDHKSLFTCSANSPLLTTPLMESVQLNIQYKPVLTVSLSRGPVEGKPLEICCASDSNPMTTFVRWMKNETTIKTERGSRNCLKFPVLHRSHANLYTCFAANGIGFSMISQELRVLYPPNVTVTYLSENYTELKCSPSGVPANYTFLQWEHQSEFYKHIRYINGSGDGKLIIHRIKNKNSFYQDNGNYICKVSNNIPDVNGNVVQTGQILILFEDAPIFAGQNNMIQFGQYGQDGNITIYVYSKLQLTTYSIKKVDRQLSNFISTHHPTTINDIFYGVTVKVRVVQVTFTLMRLMKGSFGHYTLTVCNKYGCDNTNIQMSSKSRPEPPTNLTLNTEGTSLQVKWIPGFNGGFLQEFYIEYCSFHNSNWTLIGPVNSTNSLIRGVLPGTVYDIRMFAKNKAGNSKRTNITKIRTSNLNHQESLLLPLAVLPIIAVLVVTGTIITIVIKGKIKCKSLHPSNQQEGTDLDVQGVSIENSLYQSFSSANITPNQNHELIHLSPTSSISHQSVESEGIPVENQLYHTASGVFFNEQRVPNVEGGNRSVSRIDENTVITESSLNYAEVIFESGSSTNANIIHGDEERAIYSEIDLAATAQMDPISSSSENDSDDDYMYVDGIQRFERKT